MKRIYKETNIAAVGADWQVTLDAKPMRTPARHPLVVPSHALAEAIAAEWAAQGESIDKASMPLTALACIALDVAAERAEELRAELANYATTDQLCYREATGATQAKQVELGDPLLAWAAERYGAKLVVTKGILPVDQPEAALDALAHGLAAYDKWILAGLSLAVGIARSLIVGLALVEGRIDAAQAHALSAIEETLQAEQWGMDPVQQARLDGWRRDLDAVARFLALLRV